MKIRKSASPGRRQRRLRLSKRLIGKLCSGLRNILQSAEIRIDFAGIFWGESEFCRNLSKFAKIQNPAVTADKLQPTPDHMPSAALLTRSSARP